MALIEEAVALSKEPLVCNQVEYHPYLDQAKVLEACRRLGLATVAYSPIAKGRVKDDRTLARIGDLHRKTAAQVCLRWLVQQNVAAIPRTSKLERLQENLDVFDFELSEDEMANDLRHGQQRGRMLNGGGRLGLASSPHSAGDPMPALGAGIHACSRAATRRGWRDKPGHDA